MGSEKSREDLYKQIVLYSSLTVASAILITAGYALEIDGKKLLGHIVEELGIAVMIAIVLALTIEHQSRKREERRQEADRQRDEERREAEREEIKKNVFDHVLGYRLPEGIFAELDNQILNAWFIRSEFSVLYRLSVLETDPRFLKIDGTLSYNIVNLTPEIRPYTFTTSIEKAPIEELDELVKFKSVRVTGCATPLVLDTEESLEKEVDHETRPNHKVISKSIEIMPKVNALAVINFDVLRILQGGSSFILTPVQTLGFELIVHAPKNVDVLATAYLRETFEKGKFHSPSSGTFHWKLNRPMLPYQGVYLTWKSKAVPAIKPVTAAAQPIDVNAQRPGEGATSIEAAEQKNSL